MSDTISLPVSPISSQLLLASPINDSDHAECVRAIAKIIFSYIGSLQVKISRKVLGATVLTHTVYSGFHILPETANYLSDIMFAVFRDITKQILTVTVSLHKH